MRLANMQVTKMQAHFHLKIFEDIMLYGTVTDKTLQGFPEITKKIIRKTYEQVYNEWDQNERN